MSNSEVTNNIYMVTAWAEAGLFPASELLNLRKIDSDLEGHPTPRLNFVDVGTGSLGQGLSVSAGMAYVGKNFDKANYRYVDIEIITLYCLLYIKQCCTYVFNV